MSTRSSSPHAYLGSALARRHRSSESGIQLTDDQAHRWDQVLGQLPEATRPAWQEDPVLVAAKAFYESYGHLDLPKVARGEHAEHASLAEGLKVLRKARYGECRDRRGRLLRRQLAAQDIAKWEQALPGFSLWSTSRPREDYTPGDCILGARHEWPREPFCCKPRACYLCGEDFESHPELIDHWRQKHLELPAERLEAMTDRRCEEEVRKRLFYDEMFHGPFEVRGQEQRRIVGTHATHQTSSAPGSGSVANIGRGDGVRVSRHVSGCAVCARSMWAEDLYEMDLFAQPAADSAAASKETVDAARMELCATEAGLFRMP